MKHEIAFRIRPPNRSPRPRAPGADHGEAAVERAGDRNCGRARRITKPAAGVAATAARGRRGTRAFTLIELLAVIVVIGMLAGLLLPVVSRSKQSAQFAKCTGNLRQLGLAAQLYWDDNNGSSFPYRGAATNGGETYWFGWLERGREGQRAFDPRQGVLYGYLSGKGVETCPSLSYSLEQFKLKAVGAAYGYGYNLHLSAPASEPSLNIHKMAHPAEIVLLADAAQVNTFQPPASPQHPMLEEFYYVSTNETTAHFRHRQSANAVFCDSHVGRERMLAGSLDERMPGQCVGRLNPGVLAAQ